MRPARAAVLLGLLSTLLLGSLGPLAPGSSAAADDAGARPGKAKVRVTLVVEDDGGLHGRVISKDVTCKRRVAVHVFGRDGDQLLYGQGFLTDQQGRWSTESSEMRRLGIAPRYLAVVPGETGCRVAQSPTVAPARAGRAGRSITIDYRRQGLQGRVTSKRAACERGADVAFFIRQNGSQPWSFGDTDRTNNRGRYRYDFGMARRFGGAQTAPVIAVAVGDGACRVAQSAPTRIPAA